MMLEVRMRELKLLWLLQRRQAATRDARPGVLIFYPVLHRFSSTSFLWLPSFSADIRQWRSVSQPTSQLTGHA